LFGRVLQHPGIEPTGSSRVTQAPAHTVT
jgi:hypothetical protein